MLFEAQLSGCVHCYDEAREYVTALALTICEPVQLHLASVHEFMHERGQCLPCTLNLGCRLNMGRFMQPKMTTDLLMPNLYTQFGRMRRGIAVWVTIGSASLKDMLPEESLISVHGMQIPNPQRAIIISVSFSVC